MPPVSGGGTVTRVGPPGGPCAQAGLEERHSWCDSVSSPDRMPSTLRKATAKQLTHSDSSPTHSCPNSNGTTVSSCASVSCGRPVGFDQLGTCSGHQRRTFHEKQPLVWRGQRYPNGLSQAPGPVHLVVTQSCCSI